MAHFGRGDIQVLVVWPETTACASTRSGPAAVARRLWNVASPVLRIARADTYKGRCRNSGPRRGRSGLGDLPDPCPLLAFVSPLQELRVSLTSSSADEARAHDVGVIDASLACARWPWPHWAETNEAKMTDPDTVARTYLQAWNERDESRRNAQLEDHWTRDEATD
jgi:hypothetical protein